MADEKKEIKRLRSIRAGIVDRCCNKNNVGYKYYGGRGISVCKEWTGNSTEFVKWALNNGYKPGLSIDRIDNDGNYEPNNCR